MNIKFFPVLSTLRNRRVVFCLITIAVLSCLLYFYRHSGKNSDEQAPKIVETEIVNYSSFKQTIRLIGTLHPKHSTLLVAKGSGTLDTLIPTGEKVEKGTLIAKIDNSELTKTYQMFQATSSLTKQQLERMQPLLKSGYVSGKEVEEKKQGWFEAERALAKAKIDLDNLQFVAPFSGIVGAYKKREGAQVNSGEPIVSLYDPSSLVIDFDIPCTHLAKVQPGSLVYVWDKVYKLSRVQNMVDEETHMCPGEIDVNCEHCLVGTAVDVNLVTIEKENVLVVPQQAIFLRNSKPAAYIVEDGKISLVTLITGLQQHDKIEVIEGLQVGQQLVTKGQDRLYPGLAVEIYHP